MIILKHVLKHMLIKSVLIMVKSVNFFFFHRMHTIYMLIYQTDNFLLEITTEEPGIDFDSEEVIYNSL